MLHSLKANLVNLQDENKPTLHADCCYILPVGVSYISAACPLLVLVRGRYQSLLSKDKFMGHAFLCICSC